MFSRHLSGTRKIRQILLWAVIWAISLLLLSSSIGTSLTASSVPSIDVGPNSGLTGSEVAVSGSGYPSGSHDRANRRDGMSVVASPGQMRDDVPLVFNLGSGQDSSPIAGLDQWADRNSDNNVISAAALTGPQRVMVLRVYFADYPEASRYTQAEVQGLFDRLDQLWRDTSYGNISIDYQISSLFQLPDVRSEYIDDLPLCEPDPTRRPFGDLSCDGKYTKVLEDAIAASPPDEGLDWSDVDAVMVLMAETDPAEFHRGQGGSHLNLPMGPGGAVENVTTAIFSENPSESERCMWGRWAHELGHVFQQGGPDHPSNYNSEFELMDSNYPGQTGVFEKQVHTGFPGWMPETKYQEFEPAGGGGIANVWAMEYPPAGMPNIQAVKAKITDDLYYLVSVRRRVLGDDLNCNFDLGIPDEGILIERVAEGANPWVTLRGPGGNRNKLWHEGQSYTNWADGISIEVITKIDEDNYQVRIAYDEQVALQPDVSLEPWISPPGNAYETTDIWIDSPVNGYDNYRFGWWNDLSGDPVPQGNGDVPAIGLDNRLYARVRNIGGAPATDVVVQWEITDPPGVGIAGASGWAPVGSVDKTDFPALANIDPGGPPVDVYIEWTPDFPIPEDDLEDGLFDFHVCVRVILEPVTNETVLANQDGDGEQENIFTFQASEESAGAPMTATLRLYNDDREVPKHFYLSYESDLPSDWLLEINGGVLEATLGPGEVREIPVSVKPAGLAPLGSVFGVDITASSLKLLENDLDPMDVHPEFHDLGGARVDVRVLRQSNVSAKAMQTPNGVLVTGQLSVKGFDQFYDPKDPFRVMIVGVDGNRRFMTDTSSVLAVASDGTFKGFLGETKLAPSEVVGLFAGTAELASASSGYMDISVPVSIYLPIVLNQSPSP
jgi:hypothetical protein